MQRSMNNLTPIVISDIFTSQTPIPYSIFHLHHITCINTLVYRVDHTYHTCTEDGYTKNCIESSPVSLDKIEEVFERITKHLTPLFDSTQR